MSDPAPFFCDRCSATLHPGRGEFYIVRIDAVADPSPPRFDEKPLGEKLDVEIARVLARLEHVSEQEAFDQVRRHLVLNLCNRCFAGWIEDPARL